MRFELDHLESYDNAALLVELRRVSALVEGPRLSRSEFVRYSRVHASTLEKRFGSWEKALQEAGLSDRYDDSGAAYTRVELLRAVSAAAKALDSNRLTLAQFKAHTGIDGGPVRRVFGSWAQALEAAGLSQSSLARRYTDDQCYENLLALWTHYGRQPQHDEANTLPSAVGSKAYVRRWGTWRKALAAFVVRANATSDPADAPSSEPDSSENTSKGIEVLVVTSPRGPRDIPLGLRYYVLKRDRFRCVACGRSPATDIGTTLHIDHIFPWSAGGPTTAENLRVLCMSCNLGKGASSAEET